MVKGFGQGIRTGGWFISNFLYESYAADAAFVLGDIHSICHLNVTDLVNSCIYTLPVSQAQITIYTDQSPDLRQTPFS